MRGEAVGKATTKMNTNIEANRQQRNYSRAEMLRRIGWVLGQGFFRCSPRPCFAFRRVLLRLYGARIGRQVNVYPTARIEMPWLLSIGDWSSVGEGARLYNLGDLSLGRRVTVSQGAHLCGGTHDDRDPAMPLLRRPIRIGDDAWICADAFVGPGVTVGDGAVVGARAVAVRDVAPWTVVAGNPARFIRKRELRS